ncbi:MAG: substrate-binding domain-containing protein [Chloroflexota bacterium]
MTTFDRRKHILKLVRENQSMKVIDLARLLDVSEGTIRNDLATLDEEQQLLRVRGGAVLREESPNQVWQPPSRIDLNADVKVRIARWAAELIENGDSVLFDDSTTVLRMASFLKDRRNLTVVTNGIEVARALAENTSNTVILIGGILGADGVSVKGTLAEKFLKELHTQRAFVTCSGFSLETGLTETDIHQAHIKAQMIRSAEKTIALIDSSKFGKLGLTPFASTKDIAHIFTDSNVNPQIVEQLYQDGIDLTVCEENTVSSFTLRDKQLTHYRIGFANLDEISAFSIDVRRGLERAAKDASNIDLIVADNQLHGEVALRIADDLIDRGIDLMIEYQIDQTVGSLLMNKFRQADIPVIAVDIPIIGATYFGTDNYNGGFGAGQALGEWISRQWKKRLDGLIVLEEPRAGALPASRIQGQLDGLINVIGSIDESIIYFLDSSNMLEVSQEAMLHLLATLTDKHHLAVLPFNDEAAIGALLATQQVGREADVIIVGQGADRRVREEIRREGSRIIGSTAYMPEKYGGKLIDLALKILRGEPVPPAVYSDNVFIHAGNIEVYYPQH